MVDRSLQTSNSLKKKRKSEMTYFLNKILINKKSNENNASYAKFDTSEKSPSIQLLLLLLVYSTFISRQTVDSFSFNTIPSSSSLFTASIRTSHLDNRIARKGLLLLFLTSDSENDVEERNNGVQVYDNIFSTYACEELSYLSQEHSENRGSDWSSVFSRSSKSDISSSSGRKEMTPIEHAIVEEYGYRYIKQNQKRLKNSK